MLFNPAVLLLLLLELIQNELTVKLQGILGNMSFCKKCDIFIKHIMTLMDWMLGLKLCVLF